MTLLRQQLSVLVAGVAVVGLLMTNGGFTLPALAMPDRIHAAGYTISIGKPTPAASPVVTTVHQAAVATSDDARSQWAIDLLARLGNPAPTADTVAMVVEWTLAEDASDGPGTAFGRNNPLNTTQSGFNETGCINEDCVRGYATREDGLNATIQTLSYGYYTEIVAGLQTNDPERAKSGLFASPWAASHYGYGANWPHI